MSAAALYGRYAVARLILDEISAGQDAAAKRPWMDQPAYACPAQQYIYHYWDGEGMGLIGEGWTNCETGSYHLCWGSESSNYTVDVEQCVACGGGWCP
jgi:hypothetical protein